MGTTPKPKSRSLEEVVGNETYRVWTAMLTRLVPNGRTHRLAPLIAGMLQYAASAGIDGAGTNPPEGSVAYSLLVASEEPGPEFAAEELADLLERLFEDAGVVSDRVDSRGNPYSILDAAVQEFVSWYNMPWE